MRKTLVLVAAVLASTLFASSASAFDNLTVGDTITGTNVGGISMGSFVTCNTSTFSGPVTSNLGTDLGGAAELTAVTIANCGTGNSVTANNLPWAWSIDGVGTGSMAMDFTEVLSGGFMTCRYAGTIMFAYDAADWGGNGDAPLSGSLTRVSGGSPCTSTMALSGTYNIVGPNGVIDL